MANNEAIALCDWKGCTEPATHKYRWDWGEEGHACAKCIPLMQQTAQQLSRNVALSAIDGVGAEQPLQRSERVHLIASKLAAESERDEVIARGKQLYDANVALTQQVQTHVMRAREHEAEVEQLVSTKKALSEKLEQRERELAECTDEVLRLRVLGQFVGKETTPEERGLPASD